MTDFPRQLREMEAEACGDDTRWQALAAASNALAYAADERIGPAMHMCLGWARDALHQAGEVTLAGEIQGLIEGHINIAEVDRLERAVDALVRGGEP